MKIIELAETICKSAISYNYDNPQQADIMLVRGIIRDHLADMLNTKIKEYDNQIVFYSQKMHGSPAEQEYEIRKRELEDLLKELNT